MQASLRHYRQNGIKCDEKKLKTEVTMSELQLSAFGTFTHFARGVRWPGRIGCNRIISANGLKEANDFETDACLIKRQLISSSSNENKITQARRSFSEYITGTHVVPIESNFLRFAA